MALPIANAGTSPSPIAWSSNPGSYLLGGSGTPGTGATSIVGYQWTVVSQPTDGVAALDDDTLQAPTLSPLPARGTVLLFLVVEDDDGNFSEQDPTQAPDSAFWAISIKTRYLGVEIPAAAQRNWQQEYEGLVDTLDTFRNSFTNHDIDDHDTTANGSELNTLTGGGSAAGLHTHPASDIATLSAAGVLGVIECATAPADAAHPKAVTQLFYDLSLQTTTAAAKLVADNAEVFVFVVPRSGNLWKVNIVAADGWNGVFQVFSCSEGNYLAGTFGTAIGTLTLSDSAARGQADMVPSSPIAVTTKQYIVITRSTPTSVPGAPTRHMSANITVYKQY